MNGRLPSGSVQPTTTNSSRLRHLVLSQSPPVDPHRAGLDLDHSGVAIRYSDHQIWQGPAFHRHACAAGLEGIVSKRIDAAYSPGQTTIR
jgi:ATP-dependent DNA ligase